MNVKNEDWAGLRSSKTNAEGQPSDRHFGSASVDSDMEEGDKLIMTIAVMMPIAVTMPATVLRIAVAVVWLMIAVATSLALTSTVMTVTLTDLDIFMLLALVAHFTTGTACNLMVTWKWTPVGTGTTNQEGLTKINMTSLALSGVEKKRRPSWIVFPFEYSPPPPPNRDVLEKSAWGTQIRLRYFQYVPQYFTALAFYTQHFLHIRKFRWNESSQASKFIFTVAVCKLFKAPFHSEMHLH